MIIVRVLNVRFYLLENEALLLSTDIVLTARKESMFALLDCYCLVSTTDRF